MPRLSTLGCGHEGHQVGGFRGHWHMVFQRAQGSVDGLVMKREEKMMKKKTADGEKKEEMDEQRKNKIASRSR